MKTDNNPPTYILNTLNLDATWHHWVESLAGFTFSIKYQKGRDNAVADDLSHVASKLNAEAVKSILDRVTIGTAGKADAYHRWWLRATNDHMHVNLHVMDCVAVQQEDPILKIVMKWISLHKVQDLKHLLVDHTVMEEGMAILRERKKFTIHQGALYHCHTPAGELEEALQFVVPMAHRVTAMNGCHRDSGQQG